MARFLYLGVGMVIAASLSVSNVVAAEASFSIEAYSQQDHYSVDRWLDRGLTPSPKRVVDLLNRSTAQFLAELIILRDQGSLDSRPFNADVLALVNGLPWDELDTEEKEFLAETLALSIESLGLNPNHYF